MSYGAVNGCLVGALADAGAGLLFVLIIVTFLAVCGAVDDKEKR